MLRSATLTFALPAPARRSRVSRGGATARLSKWVRGLTTFDVRRAVVGLFLLAFFVGSVVCGPAEHRTMEVGGQGATPAVSVAAKTSSGHQAPAKGSPAAPCTGHCAAHTIALPAIFSASAAPFVLSAVWSMANDQLVIAALSARLERPPRA